MASKAILDAYQMNPYEGLTPEKADGGKQSIYKFNSINHFLGWSEELAKMPRSSSKDTSDDDDSDFSLSNSLEDAFEVIRDVKFDDKDTDKLKTLIRKMKRGTVFRDEGFELDVPEYVAGSQNIWLDEKERRSASKIINEPIFIDGCYSGGNSAEQMKKLGLDILTSIYEKGVIPRKLIVSFSVKNWDSNNKKDMYMFIDVEFSDLNGIAKSLHPSTFRRLWFRLAERYEGLAWGYGRCNNEAIDKGYISLQSYGGADKEKVSTLVDTLIGIEQSK